LALVAFGWLAWVRWEPVPERVVPAGSEVRQWSVTTCGPAAVATLLNVYIRSWSRQALERECRLRAAGSSLYDLREALRLHGLHSEGFQALRPAGLLRIPRPFIAHLSRGHFVVVEQLRHGKLEVFDPSSRAVRSCSPEELYAQGAGWAVSARN
jgi:ABC-type bacteriocin/lantibiotic exporter with double-glycine peptidase domain